MANPYERRYGRGENPRRPISFARGVGIYSPYYFRDSHHYVYYENGMANHFYASNQITKGSLAFLKGGFWAWIVAFPILLLLMVFLFGLIVYATGFYLLILLFVILLLGMAIPGVILLRFLRSRYQKDSKAFYLPYADKVYQETSCPYCGGISVYGMHHECPHCGKILPPAAGPVYLN